MDLQTENRIAAMLLKEAAELRRQAEKEGVQVYLRQPKPRGRPNSRFLTATVLGVQQANRALEETEMWQARRKELELDNRLGRRTRDEYNGPNRHGDTKESGRTCKRNHDVEVDMSPSCSSRRRVSEDCDLREDEGLRDEEVDEFLRSRKKRGRGAIGSRMDETGPYLPSNSDTQEEELVTERELQEKRVVLGPPKPSLGCSDYSEDESSQEKQKAKKVSLRKERSKKHKSKDKSRDKKDKKKKKKRAREEKKSRHSK